MSLIHRKFVWVGRLIDGLCTWIDQEIGQEVDPDLSVVVDVELQQRRRLRAADFLGPFVVGRPLAEWFDEALALLGSSFG